MNLEDVEKRARAKNKDQNGAIRPFKEAPVNDEDVKPKYTSSEIKERKVDSSSKRPSNRYTKVPDYKRKKTRERRKEIFVEVNNLCTSKPSQKPRKIVKAKEIFRTIVESKGPKKA